MPGRTFRVFVSSTFSDLKAERNALARWVFPRLRALCEARGYKFQAVDLRWGVRDEAAVDQQTVRICLDEIGRCQRISPRPNFIVLMGDRYGWRPPPSTIPADEMEGLRPYITADALSLVFGDPAAPDGAEPVAKYGWYWRDENAVPAEYVLQPRRAAFEKHEVWEPVERRLREALAGAAERAGLGENARREYRASATELEVMKGAVEVADAREHVFAFFREIPNLGGVEAALPGEAARELVDTLSDKTWDGDAWYAQGRLKETLRERLGEANIWRYQAEWNGVASALDLSAVLAELPADAAPPPADAAFPATRSLCEAVWQRLSRVIAVEMDAMDREDRDPLEVEKRAHAEFGAERSRVFIGRHEPLQKIAVYLSGGPPRPLVVHGPSGSGKSALMARAITDARAAHPAGVVIQRFIGASPGASEIRPLLEGICQEIGRALGGDQAAIGDYPKLVAELPKRLALATPDRPLIVFLDALDQLGETDEARRLVWLPRDLPANVRIVVSTLEEEKYQCFPALRAGADDGDFVRVAPLTKDEGREILSEWLKESPGRTARKLTTGTAPFNEQGQVDLVLARFEKDGSPLYLKLAFEEARRWHSYDADAPAEALPGDVAGMIRALFARLSEPSQHGPLIVSRVLACLAAARYGLSDEEMLDLLWRDPGVAAELQEHAQKYHRLPEDTGALPPVIWSRLFFDLEPYLTEREIFGVRLISFYHRQLCDVAAEEYLHGASRARVHADLADYFADRWRRPDTHALLELIGHLVDAGREDKAKELLLQYEWLAKKFSTTNIHLLLGDYDELPLDPREPSGLVAAALRGESQFVSRHARDYSRVLFQCLWNRCWWYDCGEAAGHYVEPEAGWAADGPETPPWRRPGNSLHTLLETWRGQIESSLPTGVWIRSLRPRKATLDSGQLIVLTGHQKCVSGLTFSQNGRLLASCSYDGAIRVWDTQTWEERRVLLGHTGEVNSVSFDPSGSFLGSGATDATVRIWEVDPGREIHCLNPSEACRDVCTRVPGRDINVMGIVTCVAFSPDGKYIACGVENKAIAFPRVHPIIIWHKLANHWQPSTVLVPISENGRPGPPPRCIAFSPDGSWLASAGGNIGEEFAPRMPADSPVFAWDLGGGGFPPGLGETNQSSLKTRPVCIGRHQGIVWSLAFSPDGRHILTGSDDGNVGLWSTPDDLLLMGLCAPLESLVRVSSQPVNGVAFSPDGDQFAIACGDTTVGLWSTHSRQRQTSFSGHGYWAASVAFSPDGRRIASGSFDNTIRIWKAEARSSNLVLHGHKDKIQRIVVSPIAPLVATSSNDGTLRLWDLRTGRQLWSGCHEGWVDGIAWSPSGQLLASASNDQTIRLWDVATGAPLRCLANQESGHISDVEFSPRGSTVASTSHDGTVRIWDIETGKPSITWRARGDAVPWCIAFFRDGGRIVAGTALGQLLVWRVDRQEPVLDLAGRNGGICTVAVSSNGKLIAGGTEEGKVLVWDSWDGREIASIDGHGVFVSGLAFSRDGGRLVSVGGSIAKREYSDTKVWDLSSRRCLESLPGYTDVSVLANETTQTVMLAGNSETVLWSRAVRKVLAVWPDQLDRIRLDVTGRFWTGTVGDYVCVLSVEDKEQ